MDTEQLQSIGRLIELLNDSSLAKGLGDCLQITARLAARNLSAFEPAKPAIPKASPGNFEPFNCTETQVHGKPKAEVMPDEWDEDEKQFFSKKFRSIKEVAEFMDRSKTFVRDLIEQGILHAEKQPNGYYQVSSDSVKGYFLDGQTTKEAG